MLSIVVPTYNEEENIKQLFILIEEYCTNFELIIVDDSSEDQTGQIADRLAKNKNVTVLHRSGPRDLSGSIVDGINSSKGDVICTLDADLSHDPKYIPMMLEHIKEGYDIIIGSRLVKGGKVQEWSFSRKIISDIGIVLARPLTKVADPMSGFLMFNREVINEVNLNPIGYKFGLEVLVKGRYSKLKEIPIVFMNRKKGRSKMGLRVFFQYMVHVLRLYLYKFYFSSS
jgi:dolichol-phosphate mannosyltransferase